VFLLDTNVISEMGKPKPDPKVQKWVNDWGGPEKGAFYLSAVAKAEMEYGLNIMDEGAKKRALAQNIGDFFHRRKKTCLAFNARSASYYAKICAKKRKAGRNVTDGADVFDAMIAAIAIQHGLVLATNNVRDFSDIDGLKIVNPWEHRRKS